MKLLVDRDKDVISLRLDEGAIVKSEEAQPGIILDFDKHGRVIGFEMRELSARADPEAARVLHIETTEPRQPPAG